MLGLRPRPHGSIRSFALPAPAVMVAWWVVMLARGPPIRRRSEVGMRTPSPTTRPFHHTPHQPPLPTPPHTLPGNARGAQGGWRTLGWRALSASGAPPRRTRSHGTTVRSAPPLPQPRQATPFPHPWLIALAECAASDSGRPDALNVGGVRSPGGTPTRARSIPAHSCPWPSATAPSWASWRAPRAAAAAAPGRRQLPHLLPHPPPRGFDARAL